MAESKELQHWADEAMYTADHMPEGINVALLSATPDPLGAIAAACDIYSGVIVRDLGDIDDDGRRHAWEQVQQTHLKAPLEFVDLHFLVEGVTRSLTHQMVRQRTAVYAQESLRFAVKEDLADEVGKPASWGQQTASGQEIAESIWDDAVDHLAGAYKVLVEMGVPAEDARGLLPHSTRTRLHYKTNLRNLLDHVGNRLCTQAQFEWRVLIAKMMEAIRNYQGQFLRDTIVGQQPDPSWQFRLIADEGPFKPVCYQLGHCPFTADFDRKCSIRERVQAGDWASIRTEEWLADPGAAR